MRARIPLVQLKQGAIQLAGGKSAQLTRQLLRAEPAGLHCSGMEEDGDLFATIGVTAQSAEQVEQQVIDEVRAVCAMCTVCLPCVA